MASSGAASDALDVPLSGASVHIARRSAPVLQDLLRSRFCCEARFVGLDLDLGLGPGRAHVVPEKRSEYTLSSGVKVSVWKADLTCFSAEAVVNAANSKLQHFGGLALALSTAGGPGIQTESDQFVQKHGDVSTGEAVALGAGSLKCDTIIHAVGPHLSHRPNVHEVSAAKRPLEQVIRRILEIVEKKQLKTVAIPAISSGLFNFPVAECADVIVSTVKRFYGSSSSHMFRPNEVLLVNNDEPTVREMERACASVLGSYSQAVTKGNRPQTRGAAKPGPGTPQIQFGPVRVLLRKGRLEEQKMDVIVNTAAGNRDLSYGQVSRALLHKAGHKMQDEIRFAPLNRSIVITGSYNLQCKQVYHVFCAEQRATGAHELLFRSVQDCLGFAAGTKHQSIAFPAIGTGALSFKKSEIAQIMVSAVKDFAQTLNSPLEVHFVIFPSDDLVHKAFEEELKSARSGMTQTDVHQSFPGAAQSHNSKPDLEQGSGSWRHEDKPLFPPEPLLCLQSSSEENLIEAKTWIESRLFNGFNTVCFSNNFIQRLGEKELEELCDLEVEGVQVEEFLEKGRSGFIVSGNQAEDIAVTALRFEQKLQEVQMEFVLEELEELKILSRSRAGGERSLVSRSNSQIRPILKQLKSHGLEIIKVEQVQNPALEKLFQLQKAQMPSRSSDHLLQLVPLQFSHMICHIGFRPECAPPDDPALGEGLYFAADVTNALNLWTGSDRSEPILCLFVAEVLKGKSGRGRPGLVLGPGPDPRTRCDSVEGSGVTVVFSHIQTIPRFIVTCRKVLQETTPV